MARSEELAKESSRCVSAMPAWEELARKWTLGVVYELGLRGEASFNELKAALGDVSPSTLSDVLKRLEGLGVVNRRVVPTSPPRVVYSLSEPGQELFSILKELVDWYERWSKRAGEGLP